MIKEDGNELERAKAYEFLAGIFLKEPTHETLNGLKEWAKTGEEVQLFSLIERLEIQDPELKDLKQEYYDLFFVPVSGRFTPPFESAIRGAIRQDGQKTKFGAFWGEETIQIAAQYERMEFNPHLLSSFEPLRQLNLPDHIGDELAYMAYLCRLEAERQRVNQTVEALQTLEKEFLRAHLLKWLPDFVEDLLKVSQSGFYLYFAEMARDLCQDELTVLG